MLPSVCACLCLCISPIVARQPLGKSSLIVARLRIDKNSPIVARQRLGKNPLIVAMQWLCKNAPIIARQRVGRNVTAVTNIHATIEELMDTSFSMWPASYQGK
jgi:hypothetical protein